MDTTAAPLLGLVEMDNETYHSSPGISKSHLDVIAGKSPKHYWHKYLNPDREPEDPTPAKVLGSAIHSIILEPDTFDQRYAINPGIERRSNAGKAEYAQFMAENVGRVIITDDQAQACYAIRDSVHKHPLAAGLLTGGKPEQSFFAIDPETGELVKCRTDYILDSGEMIVDLKSTEDASPIGFGKSASNYRYDLQPAWYFDVLEILYGECPKHWAFLAFEKEPPYAIGIYYAKPEDIERAYHVARRDFMRIVEHKRSNHWPDYAETVEPLVLPAWTKR